MRYNNVKFIEPLAAAADALTVRQAQEMGSRGSGIRRSLRRMWMGTVCAVLLGTMGSPFAIIMVGRLGHSVTNLELVSRQRRMDWSQRRTSLAAIKGGVSGRNS